MVAIFMIFVCNIFYLPLKFSVQISHYFPFLLFFIHIMLIFIMCLFLFMFFEIRL